MRSRGLYTAVRQSEYGGAMTRRTLIVVVLAGLGVMRASAQQPANPLRSVLDPGVITTRQQITPAGAQTVFAGRVYGVTFGRSDAEIFVSTNVARTPLYQIDWQQNRVVKAFGDDARAGIQGVAWDGAGDRALISAIKPIRVNGRQEQQAMLLGASNGEIRPLGSQLGLFAAGRGGVS